MKNYKDYDIYIIGLGYVGLPLAIEFGKNQNTIGFDINEKRIKELRNKVDKTLEISEDDFNDSQFLQFQTELKTAPEKNSVFIITVPTPINKFKSPDLRPLLSASELVGKNLKKGDVVIYESTVYPGCTEEDCVPLLEKNSGLKFNKDFFCGYSPERINPGDKKNTLTNILKITSGSNKEAAEFVDELYKSIIKKGTYKATSIRVAEAAKLIENCQRDVNISFVNELALIFDRMGIATNDVLEAANTKWNFLDFKPGLVGGHCIGVDPYYMIHKAESLGYHPALIGAGRKINDNMGVFVANKLVKLMIQKGIPIKNSNVLILGFTFKENCPDTRNTRVIDIYQELLDFGANAEIHDPWADSNDVKNEYNIDLINEIKKKYDAIIIAVAHNVFLEYNINDIRKANSVVFEIKNLFRNETIDATL